MRPIYDCGGPIESLAGEPVLLWPNGAPGTPADFPPVRIAENSTIPYCPNREMTSISQPAITMFKPARPNGAAAIMAPGGGYSKVVMDKEGREIAAWLCSLGVTTFLMTYRLPAEGHENGSDVPRQDAQRAVRIVRKNASAWGIDPARIALMGASAGGHMVASALAGHGTNAYAPIDDIDRESARPDFGVLLYPVIAMGGEYAHPGSRLKLLGENPSDEMVRRYSPDQNLTRDCPEVFIVHTDEDVSVASENALLFYGALRRAGVRAEMHIFRDGKHGMGIERAAHLPAGRWPDLCAEWMKRVGMLD